MDGIQIVLCEPIFQVENFSKNVALEVVLFANAYYTVHTVMHAYNYM